MKVRREACARFSHSVRRYRSIPRGRSVTGVTLFGRPILWPRCLGYLDLPGKRPDALWAPPMPRPFSQSFSNDRKPSANPAHTSAAWPIRRAPGPSAPGPMLRSLQAQEFTAVNRRKDAEMFTAVNSHFPNLLTDGCGDRNSDRRIGVGRRDRRQSRRTSPASSNPARPAEKVLARVGPGVYVYGISTRPVDYLVKAMDAVGMFERQVSRLCAETSQRWLTSVQAAWEADMTFAAAAVLWRCLPASTRALSHCLSSRINSLFEKAKPCGGYNDRLSDQTHLAGPSMQVRLWTSI